MCVESLKLALVTRRYPPLIGGAEKVLSYLAIAFAAAGAQVTVLTSQIKGAGLPDHEDVAVETVPQAGPNKPVVVGRLSIARLATSSLRFLGTWQYMRNLERWFDRNAIDVAYVSMLKHDAYVVTRAGKRKGFPVVLRPEGAGPTGDMAWQSWGNFGRRIGLACRQADAFVCISKSVEDELELSLQYGSMRPSRTATTSDRAAEDPANDFDPQRRARSRIALATAARLERRPRAHLRGPSRTRERARYAHCSAWPRVRRDFRPPNLSLPAKAPNWPP